MSPSSRGQGHRPFTSVTRVRIPLGTPSPTRRPRLPAGWRGAAGRGLRFRGPSTVRPAIGVATNPPIPKTSALRATGATRDQRLPSDSVNNPDDAVAVTVGQPIRVEAVDGKQRTPRWITTSGEDNVPVHAAPRIDLQRRVERRDQVSPGDALAEAQTKGRGRRGRQLVDQRDLRPPSPGIRASLRPENTTPASTSASTPAAAGRPTSTSATPTPHRALLMSISLRQPTVSALPR